ncbi:GGDEF domain-containing protein [Bacillus sp. RAR_GA_16]|uniref:GGDEF domain-containing protein n=1 Tax=Bacillus sp. RAR_GA_16 TaxID=2876774 RepID=UPI001CCBA0C9|nr:GGDEF domain-containing protein [Bacillus sp. RAR_GA_16]MCA0170636.1 GGDEF domain-containing protein [Bacillus sp. RAR_GA_16]
MNVSNENDHMIEKILSLFRWVFLIIAGGYYYIIMQGTSISFLALLLFAVAYMTAAEFALHQTPLNSKKYYYMTKVSVGFDYVAFLWLIVLTGGGESPLFPIAYLIILHVAVYWKFSGGMLAALFLGGGYTGILVFSGYSFTGENLITYLFNWMFLIFIGVLGGIIVSKERTMRSKNSQLEDIARKDFLTDLYNHRSFQEDLRYCANQEKPILVVLADIDYFKAVNDEFGHLVGDQVLREIGEILKKQIGARGRAYRYGGEELAILLDSTNVEEARECLVNIQLAIRNTTFTADGERFSVTMSFGTALFPLEDSMVSCMKRADERLYLAKKQGRNQIFWYNQNVERGSQLSRF